MSDTVLINGLQISKASTILKLDNELYTGWTELKYADGTDPQFAYGAGRHQGPRGRTSGKYAAEPMGLSLYKSSAKALRTQLAAKSPSGKSYGVVTFNGFLQYIEPDDTTHSVEFRGMRWTKDSGAEGDNGDASVDQCEFSVMRIVRDGLVLFDDRDGGRV